MEADRFSCRVTPEGEVVMELRQPGAAQNGSRLQITFEEGRFRREHEHLLRTAAGYRNVYDPGRPLGSATSFAIDGLLQGDLMSGRGEDAPLRRALGLLRSVPIDRIIRPIRLAILRPEAVSEKTGEVFAIPVAYEEMRQFGRGGGLGAPPRAVAFTGALFPYGSWPHALAREAVLVVAGSTTYTSAVLARLYESDEMGPLGYLAVGALLNCAEPRLAQRFALRGTTRLSVEEFRKDCRPLFDERALLGQCVVQAAEVLRQMDGEEIEAIVELLPPGHGSFLRECSRLLKAGGEKPIAEILAPALDAYWEKTLRERVGAGLQRLASPPQGAEPDHAPPE